MMERPCLDLLPVSRLSRLWWMAVAIAMTAATGSLLLYKMYDYRFQERGKLTAQERDTDELAERQNNAPLYRASSKVAAMQRDAPWPQALAALEYAHMAGVRLVNLEFSASEGSIRIEVNLLNHELLVPYVDLLNSAPGSLEWIPKSTTSDAAGSQDNTAMLASVLRNR